MNTGVVTEKLNLWYTKFHALKDVSLSLEPGVVHGLIGPSGCGKSTLLRCFNRINERIPGVRTAGSVRILGEDVYDSSVDLSMLRRKVGMVFQRPNPLPLSVRENILFQTKIHSEKPTEELVEKALTEVGLWDTLKDRLNVVATTLPLEQQQKLCIARLLPMQPQVLLMDEPCSALDPYATARVEELILSLRGRYTILIVTHNMAQARRVSDDCVFMLLGEVIEHRPTLELFLTPRDTRTADYVEGRYG
jgi:phosphate transport system ATP-binding protein